MLFHFNAVEGVEAKLILKSESKSSSSDNIGHILVVLDGKSLTHDQSGLIPNGNRGEHHRFFYIG